MPNMLQEKSGEITPERMKRQSHSKKKCPIMAAVSDGSRVLCCKEQYLIGNWNVGSMN